MKSLAQCFIAAVEVIEAEGRDLRRQLHRTGLSLILLTAGACFAVAGIAMLLASLYLALSDRLGHETALFFIGATSVAFGLLVVWFSRKLIH